MRGELYVVLDADALLARVDAVEGYTPDDVQHSQYTRAAVPVSLGRQRAWAQAYFCQPSLGSAALDPVRRLPAARYSDGAARSDVNASTKSVIAAAICLETSTNSMSDR